MHVREQVGKNLSFSIENPDVLNIPQCTEHPPMNTWYPLMYTWYPPMYSWYPPMYSWYPQCTHGTPTCIMISSNVLNILKCTHDIPDVLMVSLRCTEHPRCTHDIPRCTEHPRGTHGIPWCSEHPRCTGHPPMYWTHIIQGDCIGDVPRSTKHIHCTQGISYIFITFPTALNIITYATQDIPNGIVPSSTVLNTSAMLRQCPDSIFWKPTYFLLKQGFLCLIVTKFCRAVKIISTQLLVKKNWQLLLSSSAEHAPKISVLIRISRYETFALNQISGTSHDNFPRSFSILQVVWSSTAAMMIKFK